MKGEGKLKIDGNFTSNPLTLDVNFACRLLENVYSLKGDMNYQVYRGVKHRLDLAGKLLKTAQGELETRRLYLDVNVS